MSDLKGLAREAVERAVAAFGPVDSPKPTRHAVLVHPADVRRALEAAASGLALDRLVQIATVDTGSAIELRYSLTGPHAAIVTVRTRLARGEPHVASVHDLFPPAALYERQVHDLFGVVFEGHPGLARLVLADDWPQGVYPLLKEFDPQGASKGGG